MLNKMSEAIRSNLTKQQRLKIVSLVTIEVHARDILERLIKTKTADGSAFEWLSQLRVYWDRVSFLHYQFTIELAPKFDLSDRTDYGILHYRPNWLCVL